MDSRNSPETTEGSPLGSLPAAPMGSEGSAPETTSYGALGSLPSAPVTRETPVTTPNPGRS
jgi:hypothetical protein